MEQQTLSIDERIRVSTEIRNTITARRDALVAAKETRLPRGLVLVDKDSQFVLAAGVGGWNFILGSPDLSDARVFPMTRSGIDEASGYRRAAERSHSWRRFECVEPRVWVDNAILRADECLVTIGNLFDSIRRELADAGIERDV